jgi:ribonuclease BN (tRNA processing enzyme)
VRIRVLGSSGSELPGYYPPAFLIDGKMLLDAGTIGARLSESEQWRIKNILITHSHLDHIKGIPFLADSIVIKQRRQSVTVFGIKETLESLSKNLLNDKLWPDFLNITAAIEPVVKLRNISPGRTFAVDHYRITAYRVTHTVPAVGYLIRGANGGSLLYTGDTGPTERIWEIPEKVNILIVEVSFPNRMEELAKKTGHLTAKLLTGELAKIRNFPKKILITHPKPQYIDQIRKEVGKLRIGNMELLEDGKVYEI